MQNLPNWQRKIILRLGAGQRLTETISEWATFEDGTKVFCDDLSTMSEQGLVKYRRSRMDVYEFVFELTERGKAMYQRLTVGVAIT